MINPAEEIVNIWLQECRKHFVMSNIVIPKETRQINGRKIGGGRGKEVDFLSTDVKNNYYWVEVSVSPNPRLPGGATKSRQVIIDNAVKKFAPEKGKYLCNNFGIRITKKWFIYSPKLFVFFKKSGTDEEKKFQDALQKRRIKAISFENVLKETYDKINYMGYDTPRQFLFLLKKFGYQYQ